VSRCNFGLFSFHSFLKKVENTLLLLSYLGGKILKSVAKPHSLLLIFYFPTKIPHFFEFTNLFFNYNKKKSDISAALIVIRD